MRITRRWIALLTILWCLNAAAPAHAFWIWSASTGLWQNPMYHKFATPREQYDWAQRFFQEANYRRAYKEFKKFIKRYPKDELAPEAQYHLAVSLQQMRKYFDAFLAYQKVIEKYPLNERLTDIVEQQYVLAEIFMKQRQYGEAKEILEKTILNAPYSKVADVAQYNLAIALFKTKNYAEARAEVEKMAEKYSFSPFADDAVFYMGLCDYKISSQVDDYDAGLVRKAVDSLEYFRRSYPTNELVPQAESLLNKLYHVQAKRLYDTGRFYQKQRKYSAALKYYEDVVQNYGQTSWAQLARPLVEKLRAQQRPK